MNFKTAKYTVVDVETTGNVNQGRMTEICIITIENNIITDVYSSLINPQENIPRNIIALTGITNEIVADAPKFKEIAATIQQKTKDAIFVAHNVNFDFGFLKKEFEFLGEKFSRKKLCTVRLSRKLLPGLPSYSLGRLCRSVGISLENAHRAETDTRATATLFLKVLALDAETSFEVFKHFLNKSSREATLPPNINSADFEKLPATTGMYLFKDKAGKILYVGKAKNIKSRVLSHIYSKTQTSINLCTATHHLDFVATGNELCALLLEADYIRQYYPQFNKAQKRPINTYQIISYKDRRGVLQLALGKTKNTTDAVFTLYNKIAAIELLMQLCETHNLCPKYCALQITNEPCSHYTLKDCKGVCSGTEDIEIYNLRVTAALAQLEAVKETYVIKDKGRTLQESSIILVEKGEYKGFGFIENTETITSFEDFSSYITKYKNTYHTTKLISGFIRKNTSERNMIRPSMEVVDPFD